jgi:N-acetylglucosamine malate deacetylase 1
MTTVLVIVAHPDDEMLGCGGTMARHAAAGDEVHILIVSEGITSRDSSPGARRKIDPLHDCARRAAALIGAQAPRFLGFPDNRLDTVPLLEVVQGIEAIVEELTPQIVYTHHHGDLNIDHQIVHRATVTACRPLPGRSVHEIFAFEVQSSTEWGLQVPGDVFQPVHHVDIEATLDRKIEALALYETEMRSWPHPRSLDSVRHLARLRGSHVGLLAAEAFTVVRSIVS